MFLHSISLLFLSVHYVQRPGVFFNKTLYDLQMLSFSTTKNVLLPLRHQPQCSIPIMSIHLDPLADCCAASNDSELALYKELHCLLVLELLALSLESLQRQCRLRGLRVSPTNQLLSALEL